MNRFIDDEKRIFLCEPSLKEEESEACFEEPAEKQLLIDDDGQRYGSLGVIKLPSWREIILATESKDIDIKKLEFVLTTSYAVQARKGAYALNAEKAKVDFPFVPCTVIGIPHTLDGKIICGVRGGSASTGKADIAGGYMTTNPNNRHPVFANFYSELEEEIGVREKFVETCKLVGYFNDAQFNTLCFIANAGINLTSDEIIRRHAEAFRIYQAAKRQGKGEATSRQALSDTGCKDAWEHCKLFAISYETGCLQDIAEKRGIKHENERYEPLQNMIAALKLDSAKR